MRRETIAVAAGLAMLLLAGCGSARRGEPLAPPFTPESPRATRGQQVFMAHCHACHPGGQAGLAPAINNKPLPGFMIKTQVRLGTGAMPRFSAREISSDDLDALVDYLQAMRRHR